jgi:hydrogenase-4 component F
VLGFGTKMGLVPMHTWLPDAHSEAPTPVSALLSGSLLALSFYAILRFYQVAEATLGS